MRPLGRRLGLRRQGGATVGAVEADEVLQRVGTVEGAGWAIAAPEMLDLGRIAAYG